jgi:hypothetical protein
MQFMGYWFMVVLPYAAQRSVINASTTLNISTNICIIKRSTSAKSDVDLQLRSSASEAHQSAYPPTEPFRMKRMLTLMTR